MAEEQKTEPVPVNPFRGVASYGGYGGSFMDRIAALRAARDRAGGSGGFKPWESLPGEEEYYRNRMAEAQRGIYAGFPGASRSIMDALDARGIGRSTEVGNQLSKLGSGYAGEVQSALSDIQAQQFLARERRIAAYMDYVYAKKLQKKGGGLWGALGAMVPYIPFSGGGGAVAGPLLDSGGGGGPNYG